MKENKIAELLIQLRKEHGLTQNDLASKLGISYQAVSKWERGENLPDAYTLLELGLIYDITVDEILKGKLIENELPIPTRKNGTTRKLKRNDEIIYLIATVIFLVLGFRYGLFYIAWIVFIIAYILTLIGKK